MIILGKSISILWTIKSKGVLVPFFPIYSVEMLDIEHVNNTSIIEQQHNMTAINSAIEVDITGQIVSGKCFCM